MNRKEVRQIVLSTLYKHQVRSQNPGTHFELVLWQEIFEKVFGSEPKGLEDSRWDHLFCPKTGYKAMYYVHLFDRLTKV